MLPDTCGRAARLSTDSPSDDHQIKSDYIAGMFDSELTLAECSWILRIVVEFDYHVTRLIARLS